LGAALNELFFDENLSPEFSKLYSHLYETRIRLLNQISAIDQQTLDFTPSIKKIETNGTLLFHIAAVEYSWMIEDIFKQNMDYEE
jgi:hypothetical protein